METQISKAKRPADGPLHLVQIMVDARRLARWSAIRKLDAGDLGYACHAAMCDAYGDLRLRPFFVEEKAGQLRILGYGSHSADEMRRTLTETAEPEVAALFLSEASKAMPTLWEAGRQYDFRVRVAPVKQRSDDRGRKQEVDAVLSAPPGSDRSEVYKAWLSDRLGGAAHLDNCSLSSFRLMSASRRSHTGNGETRKLKSFMLPDAVIEGRLRIDDPLAFLSKLRDGVGRHKSFGYGALMLRPPKMAAC